VPRTLISRAANARALEAGTAERAKIFVRVAPARSSADGQTLALPGSLQGFVQSPISARSGGYLKRWTKDIGSEVKKGELLAELDTPEIDQQLAGPGCTPASGLQHGAGTQFDGALGSPAQEGRRLPAGTR
jgi:multidrug efflux pump subunit AcrA (membrane-fusion protein)